MRRTLKAAALVLVSLCISVHAQTPSDLYINAVTIEDGGDTAPYQATVKLSNGRIAAIGKRLNIPQGARVIEGRGEYLLPGFTDMHAHVTFLRNNLYAKDPGYDEATSERTLRMLLAYGITTVRNPAAPPEDGVALRDAVASGKVLGPHIFTAGTPFNGQFKNAEDIRSEVRREAKIGVNYVKVYSGSSPQETAETIEEAHRNGLKVIGHLQETDVPTAAADGIDFVTHAVSWSTTALPVARRSEYESLMAGEHGIRSRIFWLEYVDVNGPEMSEIVRSLKEHRISVDSTLIAYVTKFVPQPAYQGRENMGLAPVAMQEDWKKFNLTEDWTPEDFARMKVVWPKMLQIVNRYYRDGVQLTTGTDLPNRFVVPGISLHQEMELLAEAGIPRQAIITMTTRNAASALGTLTEYGTITIGKHADLVLLKADPLKDIRNTRTIRYVFLDGKPLTPRSLLKK